ncbi:MAG: hypothetical protein COC09_00255 [Gammaproteobacteria bacterium]|nr:hypothetical protein [Gammaproteobacteria bacterium]PCH64944.1 MAG: hypothetical protein COC09_00255 [Gammaproteobacteria bacterium]
MMTKQESDSKTGGSMEEKAPLESVEQEWGKKSDNFYGYDSEEERLAKRGLEDWEMVDKLSDSQVAIPKWFVAVIIAVLLFAIALSFPFWGDREGFEREWFNWGFGLALVYIALSSGFIYAMIRVYGLAKADGQSDSNKQSDESVADNDETNAK